MSEPRHDGTYREPPPTDEDVDIDETVRAIWKCLEKGTPISDGRNLLIDFANRARAAEAEKWRERQTTALHSHMLATFSPDVAATEAAQQIARLTKEVERLTKECDFERSKAAKEFPLGRSRGQLMLEVLDWVLEEQLVGRRPTSVEVAKHFDLTIEEAVKLHEELQQMGEV